MFRQFSTGLTHTTSTLVTYKLERSGDRASLEVTSRSANHGMRDREKITGWSDGKTVVYSGTARESGGVLKLDLRAGDQTMVYECTRNEHPVAAADAVRGRSPGADECGDTGTWFPAATTKLSILGCREPAEPETEPAPPPETPDEAKWVKELAEREALRTQLSFAAPPGLEYLYINDHCVIQAATSGASPPTARSAKSEQPTDSARTRRCQSSVRTSVTSFVTSASSVSSTS